MRIVRTALGGVLFLLLATTGIAADRTVTWSELGTKVTPKHTVRLVLPDGTLIEGHPLQLAPDAMELSITRTSNRQAHAKGKATIPRTSVSVIEVRSPRYKGKPIGTLVPIGVGAAIVAGGIYGRQGEGDVYVYAAAGGLAIAAGAPAGFFIGRAVDRRFEKFTAALTE